MLSTPNVLGRGWIGHDSNASMQTLTGCNNNARTWRSWQMRSKQMQSLRIQDKFTLDKSVIRSEVLKSTGERPRLASVMAGIS